MWMFQRASSCTLLPSADGNFVLLNSSCYSSVSALSKAIVFQFNGPIYFATNALFKQRLFAATAKDSATSLKSSSGNNCETKLIDDGAVPRDNHFTESGHERETSNGANVDKSNVGAADCGIELSQVETADNEDKVDEPLNLQKSGDKYNSIVINCCCVSFMDSSGAKMIAQLREQFDKSGMRLVLACCSEDVLMQLKCVPQCRSLCSDSVFPSVQDALVALQACV